MTEEELAQLVAAVKAARDLGLSGDLRSQLLGLVDRLESGRIAAAEFERVFTGLLRSAYLQQVGGRGVTEADWRLVDRLVERQRGYVRGFAQDIAAGGGTMPYETRVGLYVDTLHTARQAAVVAAATQRVEWVLGAEDEGNCEPCLAAASGGPYAPGSLPGLPGVICDGGPRCRCEIRPLG